MKALAGFLLAAALASGCVLGGAAVPLDNQPPIPPGPLVAPIAGPNGGPPIECRGLPREECLTFGDLEGSDVDPDDVLRVIVTCVKVCTPQRGEVRTDLLMRNGTMVHHGQGGYETAG